MVYIRKQGWFYCSVILLLFSLNSAKAWILNDPYPKSDGLKAIYYSSFNEQPKTLDPAKSYSSNEYQFIMQIYEPPLQYDYLARPYQLVPLVAASMPKIESFDNLNRLIAPNDMSTEVAYSIYTIAIKPGIYFQPHPAFAKDNQGRYLYLHLSEDYLNEVGISQLLDFKQTGTRELVADDFLYQIKRLATPSVTSSLYGLLSEHILGFAEFAKLLPSPTVGRFLDLRKYPLDGLQKIDKYTFSIRLKNQYAQFIFWLAMPFFAPIPWEVDCFYSQMGMKDENLSFDWYPVGTGPFMLQENNPNRRMILVKNPYFKGEYFPQEGSKEDQQAGYLHHPGALLPLIHQAIFVLEKESIPRWTKFLQGYYDLSGVSTDSFDQAIEVTPNGELKLTKEMENKKISLVQTTDPSIYCLGFNMLDSVIGGNSERARKLRLAISIAVNFDENILIFFNGRGKAAQGPIPPGIFGFKEGKEGINPYVYQWRGKPIRRSLKEARKLMKEAGYANGIDPQTGEPLLLHYDVPITGGPDDKSQLEWMRKQFAKIGIELNVRATQYNRFQEKMRSGNAQLFSWGWNADYPDPENFLFLLYSKNGKVKFGGENATNYANLRYDDLFNKMKNRSNDTLRQQWIDEMVEIVRHDAPWIWGINTQTLVLRHQWMSPTKPNTINLNTLKFMAIDVKKREELRRQWNAPIIWPFIVLLFLLGLVIAPVIWTYYRKERQTAPRFGG